MAALSLFYRRLAVFGPRSFLQWLVFVLLLPISWLYGALMRLRALFYARGWLTAYRAPVPVISVGNLSVGGTGKTPVIDHLVRYCLSLNKRVAVVSRGYGSAGGPALRVVSAGQGPVLPVEQAGDEPWLLARRNPAACVVVAPRRAEGVRHAVEALGAEVVLLDDGFQHLAVVRDFDIVLLDATRPFGNGWVLPAGLLREPVPALSRGHLFLLTRCPDIPEPAPPVPGPVLHCRHRIADLAVEQGGGVVELADLVERRGVAFAGIAEPEGFFRDLEHCGLHLARSLRFPDHAAYDEGDLALLAQKSEGADYLITTEKDGVKLFGKALPLPCFQVPLQLEFLEKGELERHLLPVICNHR